MSVLTEEEFFLGKPDFVKKLSETFSVPVLVKDFILDEGQIYEARFNGASAVLLIAAILDEEKLRSFIRLSGSLDLDCLVEVHDMKQVNKALSTGAEIIGINNRDIVTFEVDTRLSERLIPAIAGKAVTVAESGIKDADEVRRLREIGAHAVLIGETFMRAADIGRKIKEIMGESTGGEIDQG